MVGACLRPDLIRSVHAWMSVPTSVMSTRSRWLLESARALVDVGRCRFRLHRYEHDIYPTAAQAGIHFRPSGLWEVFPTPVLSGRTGILSDRRVHYSRDFRCVCAWAGATVLTPRLLTTGTPREIVDSLAILRAAVAVAQSGAGQLDVKISKCREIDPGGVLLLLHVARMLHKQRKHLVMHGTGPVLDEVVKHVKHYQKLPVDRVGPDNADGDYLLRGVAHRDDMVSELTEWGATVQKKTSARNEDIAEWQMQVGEAVANGFQHGPTELTGKLRDILVAGKAYDDDHVQLAALDEGSGIPKVIKRAPDCPSSDDGALIRFACQPRVTSKCHRTNQGAGLATLVRAVRKNGGFLAILSGNGFAHVSRGRIYSQDLAKFPTQPKLVSGTLTILKLRMTDDDQQH